MPPVSRYRDPPPALVGSIPATPHRRCSSASVPLLSPRETNGACALAIAFNAATASRVPATCAQCLIEKPSEMASLRSAAWIKLKAHSEARINTFALVLIAPRSGHPRPIPRCRGRSRLRPNLPSNPSVLKVGFGAEAVHLSERDRRGFRGRSPSFVGGAKPRTAS